MLVIIYLAVQVGGNRVSGPAALASQQPLSERSERRWLRHGRWTRATCTNRKRGVDHWRHIWKMARAGNQRRRRSTTKRTRGIRRRLLHLLIRRQVREDQMLMSLLTYFMILEWFVRLVPYTYILLLLLHISVTASIFVIKIHNSKTSFRFFGCVQT